jgi:hypothetical protein
LFGIAFFASFLVGTVGIAAIRESPASDAPYCAANGREGHFINRAWWFEKGPRASSDRKCAEGCSRCVLRFAVLVLIVRRKRIAFEKYKLATDSG